MPATSQSKIHNPEAASSETTGNGKPGTEVRGPGRRLSAEEKAQREGEKRARFLKVAQRRTRTALKALDSLANCSNRATYAYTQHEVEQILGAINKRVDDLNHAFSSVTESEPEFSL